MSAKPASRQNSTDVKLCRVYIDIGKLQFFLMQEYYY